MVAGSLETPCREELMARSGRKPKGDTPKDRTKSRHKKPRESFHLDKALQDALIAFTENARPRLDKTAVIVTALEEFLTARGVWPPPPKDKD
jgi:hypothetical protein